MSSTRFFEYTTTGVQRRVVAASQTAFVLLTNSAPADTVAMNLATFLGKSFLTPPPGLSINEDSFTVYVNGVSIDPTHVTVQESGSNITVTFNPALIGYDVESTDTVILTGKFS